MTFTDNFKIYNLNFDIKINDAAKVTSSKNESFWVEIYSINGDEIIGKVMNDLVWTDAYSLHDMIQFNMNNIKTVNKCENRFVVTKEMEDQIKRFFVVFKLINNREPTFSECERYCNTRIINN